MSTSGRKGRGRQKIEMKKMESDSNLQVTFSKRRGGLFKKASELCTLCGVEIALIVFSPGQKVFSFGNPSVEAIIERYLSRGPTQPTVTMHYIEAQRNANVRELNKYLSQINNQLDADMKRKEELNCRLKAMQSQFWWACLIESMDKSMLEKYRVALVELKKKVTSYCDELFIEDANVGSAVATNPPINQFFSGGPSNSMIPLHHPPPPPPQVFPPLYFQAPMMQANHFLGGFNNNGGYGGPPPGFY